MGKNIQMDRLGVNYEARHRGGVSPTYARVAIFRGFGDTKVKDQLWLTNPNITECELHLVGLVYRNATASGQRFHCWDDGNSAP